MNEQNEQLERGLKALEKVLSDYPNLTHVYMRREDEVLVDVSREQAKATLIRHPNWTIEPEQRTGLQSTVHTEKDAESEPDKENEEDEIPELIPEHDTEVPPKPSEGQGMPRHDHNPFAPGHMEAHSLPGEQPESKSVQRRKSIQKGKK